MGAIRAYSQRKRWTDIEVEVLRAQYAVLPRKELIKMFPDRDIRTVEAKANWLGLKRPERIGRTPDEIREAKRRSMAKSRAADPAKARQHKNDYHAKNREARTAKMREYAGRRFFWVKAMKLRGAGRATTRQIALLWKKQKGLCALTGRRLDRTAQLDHKLPKARGGGDGIDNLQWVCEEANLAKRDMTDAEFVALCGSVMRWIGERIQAVEKIQKAAA